jgi:uncharacterized protein YjbI with pentapeptide repeats
LKGALIRGEDLPALISGVASLAPGQKVSLEGALLEDVRAAGGVYDAAINFHECTFRDVDFFNSVFNGFPSFRGTRFEGSARFSGTTFARGADFAHVQFSSLARFAHARFGGATTFESALFQEDADFEACRFDGACNFADADMGSTAHFAGARFSAPLETGPFSAKYLDLSGCLFDHHSVINEVQVEEANFSDASFLGSARISLHGLTDPGLVTFVGASFTTGATIRLPACDVYLNDAYFGGPSSLAGDPETPRLWSLDNTDVRQLTLAGIDVRGCRLRRAFNLDGLSLRGCTRPKTPSGLRLAYGFPPLRRWMRRDVIAAEREWRARRPGWKWGWQPMLGPRSEPADPLGYGQDVIDDPKEIARLYRALRKGLEDAKNTPAAAGLYYGEMEMRRAYAPWYSPIRWLLVGYWAVSGYGTRASRSIGLFLCLALLTGTALLNEDLFPRRVAHESSFRAGATAVGMLIRLTTIPRTALPTTGLAIQIAAGFIGPIVLGLAILALRGRLHR